MAFCSNEYFDQIGNIQNRIHERERRRHELEEKLFAYLRSEERLTKIKCFKMHCCYKELHERERQAKTRNLELLGNVESLSSKLKEFSIDCRRLLQKRLEYKNHITRQKKDGKKMESGEKSEANEVPSSTTWGSQNAVIFTGHPTYKHITDTCLLPRTELTPNRPSLFSQQNGLLMHPCVSTALTDDVLNSSVFLEGGRVNDMHEKQMKSYSDISQRLRSHKDLNSTRTTLKEAELSSQSMTSKRPAAVVSSEQCPTPGPLPDTTDPRDTSQYSSSRGQDAVALPIKSNGDMQEHPITQMSQRLRGPLEAPNRLSMEGLCHLLDSIEQRLGAKDMSIYHSCTVSEQSVIDIISICNRRGHLDGADLQLCAAVVLQQLPMLCCSLSDGCLLPSDLINTYWSSATKPEQIRSCLSAEGALLWDRCFRHMLHLKQQEVLSTDLTVQLFMPLLVLNSSTYTDKAEELLKRLLTCKSDSQQPSESEHLSSCSLPSLLDDSVEIKPARPSKIYSPTNGKLEIQSAEEDSADQSPVESIPIRETKEYQLLKQSVAQERRWSDLEEENSESADINKLERAEALRDSFTQNNWKSAKSKTQVFSAVQSKAFWGESDDSNSEIDLALRPQSCHSSANDFDDFYD